MAETLEQKIARLESELAAARSRLFSSRQDAALSRTRASQAERDELGMAQLLREIALLTSFPTTKPVSHLPSHVRALVQQAA